MKSQSSRERMLSSIQLEEPDHIPCAFMIFTAKRNQLNEDLYELAKAELAMGLDSFLFIPSAGRPLRPEHPDLRGLPVRFDEHVFTREWRDQTENGAPTLHKVYQTPAGDLSCIVKLSDDWPHGNHIPFIDDYQVPRSIKSLVGGSEDLEPFRFLLQPPSPVDMTAYAKETERAHAFIKQYGILLAGGWGVGMDMVAWLCGIENMMIMAIEQEAFIRELLGLIGEWNLKRMEVVLSGGVDLYIRRAWYEGCDFITPRFFRKVLLPQLQRETALAHEHNAKFGYICSSGLLPMLDLYQEAGIDVLIGIDPVQGTHTDLEKVKARIGERICIWGGVSGAVTVELGTEEDVRQAVRGAITKLGSRGFILSPVDNITVDAPKTWQNIEIFIDEWQRSWVN
jgi:Uroporphyrinogen decarboxylase (URO-D)